MFAVKGCRCFQCRDARRNCRVILAVVVLFVLFGLFGASRLASQQDSLMVSEAKPDTVRFWEGDPGNRLLPSWEYVKRCSGEKEKKGGRYTDIKWIVVSPHGLDKRLWDEDPAPERIVGRWSPPDTILIDSLYMNAAWVIQHEMLHHLLRGRLDANGDAHPSTPFRFPCMLMGNENVPEVVK